MPQLKPFQQEGARFLAARTRALLACEPGTGKTAQVVEACRLIRAGAVLVVCPSIAIEHWHREFRRWYQSAAGAETLPNVEVISYDAARDLVKTINGRIRWDVLVVDEVHYAKSITAKRTHSVFAPGGLGYYARRIWALSGTPAPNNAAELYPMLKAFGATKMDFEQFKKYFCVVDGLGKIRGNRPDHIEELRVILKGIALRKKKKDVLPELGEISIEEWFVTPRPDFVEHIADLPEANALALHRKLAGLSDDEILALLSDPSEALSTLRRYNALLKAPAVFETVKFELENGLLDKVVIYGYHKEALAALHREFARHAIGSVLINGDTPMGERDKLIEEWKHQAHTPVFIGSLVVASTAIDLTAAHQGIVLELDWTPGVNAQALQRMHRHGQEKPVTVRVAHGTPIDEIVTGVVLRKTKDLAEIFS